jgi:3-alpha domain
VAEINRVMNVDRNDREGIERLLASPELPQKWRDGLERRLAGVFEDDSARLGTT